MRIGLVASALDRGASSTTFVGGYAAAATGETNPFVAVADLTSSTVAARRSCSSRSSSRGSPRTSGNVYTAGLSLVNSLPRLGRLRATILVAAAAVALSALPDVVDRAQKWIVAPRQRRGAAERR